MGTYISSPRSSGRQTRLVLILVAVLRVTVTEVSAAYVEGQAQVTPHTEGQGHNTNTKGQAQAMFETDEAASPRVRHEQLLPYSSNVADDSDQNVGELLGGSRWQLDEGLPAALWMHRQRRHHQKPPAQPAAKSREYHLYNSCSKLQVRMVGEEVDAAGSHDEEAARLVLVDAGNGRLLIRRLHSSLYLCFSRKGALVVKHEASDMCIFEERLTDNQYTELQLAAQPSWLVGFKKTGEPMRGYEHLHPHRRRKCFQFTKRQYAVSYSDDSSEDHFPRPIDTESERLGLAPRTLDTEDT